MIPYKVYKINCVPVFGIICFVCLGLVLKSGSPNPNNIKDFRPISLLNGEEKLFFNILSKRLKYIFLVTN